MRSRDGSVRTTKIPLANPSLSRRMDWKVRSQPVSGLPCGPDLGLSSSFVFLRFSWAVRATAQTQGIAAVRAQRLAYPSGADDGDLDAALRGRHGSGHSAGYSWNSCRWAFPIRTGKAS